MSQTRNTIMKTPLIIPIGRSKSGKDEFYKIVKDYFPDYEVVRFSFADYLYELTAETLGISVEELRKEKEKYRHYLIFGGMFARKIDDYFWVDNLQDKLRNFINNNDVFNKKVIIIITDCRFMNELLMLVNESEHFHYKLNTALVELYCTKETLINRGYNMDNYNHESETLSETAKEEFVWPPKHTIHNNSSYEKYRDEVVKRVSEILEECK